MNTKSESDRAEAKSALSEMLWNAFDEISIVSKAVDLTIFEVPICTKKVL